MNITASGGGLSISDVRGCPSGQRPRPISSLGRNLLLSYNIPVTDERSTGLVRRLGFFSAVLSGLGVTIGAGIYVLIGAAAGSAGNAVWLSFILAAVAAAFTALSYARLVALRPKDAPEFQYVSMAFGRGAGFLAGWLMLWAAFVSAAVISLGFAGYLENLFNVPIAAGALGLVAVTALVTLAGIRHSVAVLGILTVPTVLGLVAIIIIGAPYIGDVDLLEAPRGFAGIWGGAALVFYAFLGFNGMANLAEEMNHPEKDLPRAMVVVLATSTVLYVLVAIAAVSVVGWADLARSSAPVAEVMIRTLGTDAGVAISLVSLAATGSTGLFLLLSASRAVWAMSCAGVLPLPFCSVGQRRTPGIAILGVAAIASLFIAIMNVETVARFSNIAVLLAFAAVNAAAMKLFGQTLRGRLLPGLGLIFSLWLALNTELPAMLYGAALTVTGVVFYRVMVFRGKRPGTQTAAGDGE